MIRIASREALEKIVEKLSPSPKPIKLSEHSMAAGVDAALRRCDPEQEAVLRSRIIALEAEVAELNASRPVAELSPRRSGWLFKYNSLAATLGWLGDHARAADDRTRTWPEVVGHLAAWWSSRATRSADLLNDLADDARTAKAVA